MYFKANDPSIIPIPDSSSDRWEAGKPLDAGTLQIFQNNLATFHVQNGRTLATQNGGLSNLFFNNLSEASLRGFSQSRYPAPINFSSAPLNRQLAWGSNVAMKFGPFYLPTESTGITRAVYLPINVLINITVTDSCSVYVAVNNGENPFINTPYFIQKASFSDGNFYYIFDIKNIIEKPPLEENVTWMNSNTSYEFDTLTPLYVWVGLYRQNTNTNFTSITISNPRFV
jgi:hypothetical protein